MARQLRPRVLAVGFGIYFAIIGIGSWQFAQSLPGPWYPADITRWVYTTYMLVAAIFLVGLAGLGLSGMMPPGADSFAQFNHHLNTALILWIGYSWVGVGWYVALTVYGLVGGAGAPRRR